MGVTSLVNELPSRYGAVLNFKTTKVSIINVQEGIAWRKAVGFSLCFQSAPTQSFLRTVTNNIDGDDGRGVEKREMRHFPLWWLVHTKEEREQLKRNIAELGIKEPIKVSKIGGIIVDGNLRYEIARELGIEVSFTYARLDELCYYALRSAKRLLRILYRKVKACLHPL
jgi:hypothetical protein